jgi:hypothetical protein
MVGFPCRRIERQVFMCGGWILDEQVMARVLEFLAKAGPGES